MSNDEYWKNDEIYSKQEKEEWLEKIELAYDALVEQITKIRVDASTYPDQHRLEFVYLSLIGAADSLQDSLKEGESYCKNCLRLYINERKCTFYDYTRTCEKANIPFEMNFKANGVDKFPPILENLKQKRQERLDSLRKKNKYKP